MRTAAFFAIKNTPLRSSFTKDYRGHSGRKGVAARATTQRSVGCFGRIFEFLGGFVTGRFPVLLDAGATETMRTPQHHGIHQ